MNKPTPPLDMWDRLSEVESAAGILVVDSLEDGWFTRVEYAKQRGIPSSTAKDRLARLVKAGALETKTLHLRTGEGCPKTRIYRIKEQVPNGK